MFVRDLITNTTTVVSATGETGVLGNGHSSDPAISADGRFVAFTSEANNLVTGDTNNRSDVFVRDLANGTTTRVSQGFHVKSVGRLRYATTAEVGNNGSHSPSISADGRYVAFASDANNLVIEPGLFNGRLWDDNNRRDIFVRDLLSGATSLVSTGNATSSGPYNPAISAGGGHVSYVQQVAGGDAQAQILVRDLATATVVVASLSPSGVVGNLSSNSPSISADGHFVAFVSDANNLVPGDSNDRADIFVRDLQGGTTAMASRTGQTIGSFSPSLSANGRYVAFFSGASDLVVGDTNSRLDVFVRDLQSGTTSRVSTGPLGQANDDSYYPSISANGRYVAYVSLANNLAAADNNARSDVFLLDQGQALEAQGGAAPAVAVANRLTYDQVQPVLVEALTRWTAAGVSTSGLNWVPVRIAELSGSSLGMADGNTIWLDSNAASWGWFVDATPRDDWEFLTAGNQGEQHRIDLLTVIMHELGHLLGLGHVDDGIMAETLATGVRRTETSHDNVAMTDQVLSLAENHRSDAWLGAWLSNQFGAEKGPECVGKGRRKVAKGSDPDSQDRIDASGSEACRLTKLDASLARRGPKGRANNRTLTDCCR